MKQLSEIEYELLKFIHYETAVELFECWVYQKAELESYLATARYFLLISLDFKDIHIVYHVQKIIYQHIDFSAYKTILMINMMDELIEKNHNFSKNSLKTYEMYCCGLSFLADLGLGYGLNFFHHWKNLSLGNLMIELDKVSQDVKIEAERIKQWLLTKKVIITHQCIDELVTCFITYDYIDHRIS